ncbi:glycosyltransferase family 2 protein [Selenomonas sp.]|uniref:glycosyltransferase family 2 protein n=1 Tax=Selenomonas sp. TaxID=2053611 RepID=UPI002A749BE4|nr:glycosyltransferase [Selenomonas sp.]MDY3296700.1 glycosyltransferase [Selenomonas sp.]
MKSNDIKKNKMEGKHMCDVSVLVPVYNVKSYLRQCLDSLVAQTLASIEFICIDDGSTDGCCEILDAYAAKDARFHVIHKANSGYGATMNVGLRAAQGKYIGIVESDDFADAEMFKALYAVAEEHQAEIVKSNCWSYREGTSTFWECSSGHRYEEVLSPARDDAGLFFRELAIWACLYRRDFLMEHEIWFNETPGAAYQDVSFGFITKACAQRLVLVKEAYLHYRRDNAGSSVHSKGKIFSLIDEYDCIEHYLERHPLPYAEKLHAIAAEIYYSSFGFVEHRIGSKSWFPFWQRAYLKLQVAKEKGYLSCDIGAGMEDWMFRRYQSKQKADILVKGFLVRCKTTLNCYLYGAGAVAKGMIERLEGINLRPSGILVSQMEGNPVELDGVPVYAMQDASIDREHDAVVIAVTPRKPEVQQEIFTSLVHAGYRNVIVLTKELQQALR